MPANLENSAVATGLEKVSFHSNPKERQCQRMLKLPHNCTYLRIWNSWTGIPSPPLALFIVMLSKSHLTSHSRMSGSSWVITPSWLSGSWRSFLYSSSVYSCHLFLITSVSVIQYCISLWQTSTWISPRYTFIFSLLNLPPTSHPVLPF